MDILFPFDALAPYDVLMLRCLFTLVNLSGAKKLYQVYMDFRGEGGTWGARPILTQGKKSKGKHL